MFIMLAIIVLLVLSIGYIIYFLNKERNIKQMLTSTNVLSLRVITGFSVNELISRLKRYYAKCETNILLEYADNKFLEFNTNDSKEKIFKLIEEKQEFMIQRRYNPVKDYDVKDYIDKVMFDIWLDYSYRNNYKTIFWREIGQKYDEGEISTSSYNEINRRFYSYKFLDNSNAN